MSAAPTPRSPSAHDPLVRGFTLLELIVVLVIAAALTTLVAAQYSRLSSLAQLRSSARETAAALRHARSEAITYRRETAFVLDLRQPRYAGLQLEMVAAHTEVAGEQAAAIRFFPDGSSTGGRVALGAGARRYVVDVDWLTGRVAIHE